MSDPSTSSGPAVPVTPESHTISFSLPPMSPPRNLPRLDLIQGRGEEYINVGIPLYVTATEGDWKTAESILRNRPELIRFALTENHETLLHIAASVESSEAVEQFVVNLVYMMVRKDLELQNKSGDTALSLAAQSGNKKIAKTLLAKNPSLSDIPDVRGLMPLYLAALFAKAEMVRYLYDLSKQMSGDYWNMTNRGWVLQKCVEGEIFDVAIKIVNDRPELLESKGLLHDLLLAMAKMTDAFEEKLPNGFFRIIKSCFAVIRVEIGSSEEKSEALLLLRTIWRKISKLPKNEIDGIVRGKKRIQEKITKKESEALSYLRKVLEKLDTESKIKNEIELRPGGDTIAFFPNRVLFVAAKMGNVCFITEFVSLYPDAIWKIDDKGRTLFHVAIKQRDLKVYKLIYDIGPWKNLITPVSDTKGNNMLHTAAKYSNKELFQSLSGAVFHMQRELLWFKEVEKIMPAQYRKRMNDDGKTPQDLFTETHVDLLKSAEDWMKNTASQCMVVSTLIATIAFAAAFTLPGGYNQEGIPVFRKKPALVIFVISDAVSLISSSIAILMFLSIFTSRFAEKDFLVSLPRKLVYGVAALFFSIATMMLAFCASFFVLYNKKLEWLPITITGLASIPVILYGILQNDLFKDGYKSAYQSKYLFKRNKRIRHS